MKAAVPDPIPKRVIVFGASGTIGQASVQALVEAGHTVVAVLRPQSDLANPTTPAPHFAGAEIRYADGTDPASLAQDAFGAEPFDVALSCLASRTGAPDDAWQIDFQANVNVLAAAKVAGVSQMILVSAMCVQKPLLAFQQAKLAFEGKLTESGLTYSIVRPTAFFKSLSGQIARVQQGKPFLVFGDGTLTACKPISDRDLARYLVQCIDDPHLHDAVLPIGGPGEPVTGLDQAKWLFDLLGQEPRIRHVPVRLMDAIIGGLRFAGRFSKTAAAKAQLARIGRYYATESMLVLDPQTGAYSAEATPSTGTDTLADFYAEVVAKGGSVDLGDHSVFGTK